MKRIILITSKFPYIGGEQFLETEIKYYANIELIIMPKVQGSYLRKIPTSIVVDNFLAKNSFTKSKLIYLLKALRHKVFYKELISEKFINIKKIKRFLSSIYLYQMYYELFDSYFSKVQDLRSIIVYTYWNDEITYALQSLKEKYHYGLISRIHRGDLYKERRAFEYMPLKKHFTKNIDTLYTITKSANQYLKDTYGFDEKLLELSRLGVDDRKIITKTSPKNVLNIVSCSFLSEVKQIDKIIRSLKVIATQMKLVNFFWTHIGDGILYDELLILAKNELNSLDNIQYSFVGNYENEKVYQFYSENTVDVFLNVSLSEGVPVSIMEAMSCHIPIIAPDIGGIKDMLIDNYNGFLLSEECLISDIVKSLKNIDFFKDLTIRKNSYKIFLEKYDAQKNYTEFREEILSIGMHK